MEFVMKQALGGATKDMGKMLGGDEEKDPDAAKKEEERQEALRQEEEERKAKYAKMEAEREAMRQGIRDKYGIKKKEEREAEAQAAMEANSEGSLTRPKKAIPPGCGDEPEEEDESILDTVIKYLPGPLQDMFKNSARGPGTDQTGISTAPRCAVPALVGARPPQTQEHSHSGGKAAWAGSSSLPGGAGFASGPHQDAVVLQTKGNTAIGPGVIPPPRVGAQPLPPELAAPESVGSAHSLPTWCLRPSHRRLLWVGVPWRSPCTPTLPRRAGRRLRALGSLLRVGGRTCPGPPRASRTPCLHPCFPLHHDVLNLRQLGAHRAGS
ncbi:complexin-1 isoform 2-T3 [Lycaon pictus]